MTVRSIDRSDENLKGERSNRTITFLGIFSRGEGVGGRGGGWGRQADAGARLRGALRGLRGRGGGSGALRCRKPLAGFLRAFLGLLSAR